MQQKPIDLARLGTVRCAIAPEPRTTPDGEVRRDREGNPQWTTGLMVRQVEARRADVIHVVTSTEPLGVLEGEAVTVTDLWANDWAVDGRSGVSFRAAAIAPASAGGSGQAAAPSSSSSVASASSSSTASSSSGSAGARKGGES
ncbi:hypothetical protein [Streptomyces sp. AA1529]|uniref:hypothetical protein n=1 Tax=Streptomyces sp. AA1529 TaxID=1203257 RepID=UPI00030F6383|nr:hypothetical protein [Streptomyces sp. AA1529]